MEETVPARDARTVAQDHLDAVLSGDPRAMAADYAADATLRRGDMVHVGREAIEAYFAGVPDRLGDARVVFDRLEVEDDRATFWWHLDGADASGRDVIDVRGGEIVSQVVHLDGADF